MFKVPIMVLWALSQSRSKCVGGHVIWESYSPHSGWEGDRERGGAKVTLLKGMVPVNELPSVKLCFLKIPPPLRRTMGW